MGQLSELVVERGTCSPQNQAGVRGLFPELDLAEVAGEVVPLVTQVVLFRLADQVWLVNPLEILQVVAPGARWRLPQLQRVAEEVVPLVAQVVLFRSADEVW